jgi:hypothetical protein
MNKLIRYFRANWESILIAGIFLPLFGSAVIDGNLFLAVIAVIGGLAFVALIYKMIALFNQSQPPLRGENVAFQVQRRGLIFTVGGQLDTVRTALRRQKPEYLALICSDRTEGIANQLRGEFDFDEEHFKKEIIDPYNIEEIRSKTEIILNWLTEKGLRPEEIVADITGGMTTMSVGVFSATEEKRIDSQYIRSQYDEKNKPIPGTQEAIFISRYSDV